MAYAKLLLLEQLVTLLLWYESSWYYYCCNKYFIQTYTFKIINASICKATQLKRMLGIQSSILWVSIKFNVINRFRGSKIDLKRECFALFYSGHFRFLKCKYMTATIAKSVTAVRRHIILLLLQLGIISAHHTHTHTCQIFQLVISLPNSSTLLRLHRHNF